VRGRKGRTPNTSTTKETALGSHECMDRTALNVSTSPESLSSSSSTDTSLTGARSIFLSLSGST
jgi:hypothetical protein